MYKSNFVKLNVVDGKSWRQGVILGGTPPLGNFKAIRSGGGQVDFVARKKIYFFYYYYYITKCVIYTYIFIILLFVVFIPLHSKNKLPQFDDWASRVIFRFNL